MAPRFSEYGIPVPLKFDRSSQVFFELKSQCRELAPINFDHLPKLNWGDMRLAHDLDYIARLTDKELCRSEILNCYETSLEELILKKDNRALEQMPQDVLDQCRGTYHSALYALENECSFFLGGGMHHAMSFAGRGFCLLNDLVVGARKLQQDHKVKKILIIDVDAHKGDGSAQICQHDQSIYTLSLHMKNSWPIDGSLGPGPWDIPSDKDIEFEVNEENNYCERLKQALDNLNGENFDFTFVVLGADVWEFDQLPSTQSMKLSLEQILERDQIIETYLSKQKIPRTYVMGGGYGERAYEPYVNFIKKLID